jgi:ribosomal protein S18 acetylase RimI-like enzyme
LAGAEEVELDVRLIEPGDDLRGLSLGDEKFTALKTFLQRNALSYQRQSLARTYGAFTTGERPKVMGYVTLVCGEITTDTDGPGLIQDEGLHYNYNHYPAVKIARLAVHSKMRSRNLGLSLVELAIGTAQDIVCPAVGCRFIVVDSKKDSVGFYEKCGFTLLDTAANKARAEPVMFIDLSKLAITAEAL